MPSEPVVQESEGYDEVTDVVGSRAPLFVCRRCRAVVLDRSGHGFWHLEEERRRG